MDQLGSHWGDFIDVIYFVIILFQVHLIDKLQYLMLMIKLFKRVTNYKNYTHIPINNILLYTVIFMLNTLYFITHNINVWVFVYK